MKRYSEKEKTTILEKIETDLKNGMAILEAAKAAGINPASYYIWKRKMKKTVRAYKRKPQLVTLPLQDLAPAKSKEEKVVILMGMPSEINKILSKIGVNNG